MTPDIIRDRLLPVLADATFAHSSNTSGIWHSDLKPLSDGCISVVLVMRDEAAFIELIKILRENPIK